MNQILASYGNLINLVLLDGILAYAVWLALSANMFSFATGGFMAIGAYVGVVLTMRLGVPFPLAVVAAAASAAGVALALGGTLLRLRGDYFALATLAFTEVVRVIALNWESVTGGALGIVGIARSTETWHLAAGLGAVIYFAWALRRSHIGRAIAAIRADELPTAAMGVDIFRYRLALFVTSGAVTGLAGALAGHMNYFIGPNDFGLLRTIDAISYSILGGIGVLAGPGLGALVLTALPELLRFSSQLREILVGALLLGAVLFLPRGLAALRLPAPSARRALAVEKGLP